MYVDHVYCFSFSVACISIANPLYANLAMKPFVIVMTSSNPVCFHVLRHWNGGLCECIGLGP